MQGLHKHNKSDMRRIIIFVTILSITFHLSFAEDSIIPDIEGMNIKGVVKCNGKPVECVQVSDGRNFTTTDKNGYYYLNSDKENGFVFICNPDGYSCVKDNMYPRFYKTIDSGNRDVIEQADFELKKNCKEPAIVFLADLQMCGRNNDTDQFIKYVVPDLNSTLRECKTHGKEVYVITLGDQAYNTYWNLKGYGIPEIRKLMENITADYLYNCMGNHDNIPATGDDRKSEELYRKFCGPTYYSFNLGGMHFVVLDNISYNNKPGLKSYDCDVTEDQLDWLVNDIKNVSRDKPLVLCMHAPLFEQPMCINNKETLKDVDFRGPFGARIQEIVKDFKDVRVFTGHTHVNNRVKLGNMYEYNVAGTCGSLWWTGLYTPGHSICTDGSPAGYQVLIPEKGKIRTFYKSIGFDSDYQFCCYDLNNCNITAAKYAPKVPNETHFNQWLAKINYGFDSREYYDDGTPKHPNRIMINVFGFGPGWSIEASENGKSIGVVRVNGCDPLSTISDGCKRREAFGKNKGSEPKYHSHLFVAQATTSDSPVVVKVTDDNGITYTHVFNRPQELSIENYKQTRIK